ncbi:DUF5808 domain-containing protein [Corynebacterium senegalense]|uniref:DUF5808 domain-containing protein n=1 Tax=Corynebacterium senegalense TaxID=2080750 RepID=UPI000E1FFEF4|nr:DUF5808 domain-containing protein [Corynebacterium senegalense]
MNAFNLTFAALMALVTLSLAAVPRLSPAGIVLGARVPRDRMDHPVVTDALRTFRAAICATAAVVFVGVALFAENPLVIAVAPMIATVAFVAAFASQNRKILRAKRAEGWFDGVPTAVTGSVSSAREPRDRRVPWVCVAAALAVIAASALYRWWRFDDIPERFPTHFGPDFQPDAFADKTPLAVFQGSLFALALQLVMAVSVAALTRANASRRADRTAAGAARSRAVLDTAVSGLSALTLIVTVGITAMDTTALFPAYAAAREEVFVVFIGAVLLTTAALILRSATVRARGNADAAASAEAESPDNDANYIWGIFYANPDDPAVVVEKRVGVGFDFNYAHWQGKAFAAVTVLVLVAAIGLVAFA